MKTSIKDVPLANDALITEVAKLNKTTKGQVKDCVDFVGTYISGIIREGAMEGAMIPKFGKFTVKVKKHIGINKVVRNRANGKDMIYSALKGREIVDRRTIKPKTDEVI